MVTEKIGTPGADIYHDDQAVYVQGDRTLGNTFPEASDDWLENIGYAMNILSSFSSAYLMVRMRGLGVTGFQDLDTLELNHGDVLHTDGFITTNPDIVMHVNPADCGEIALHGFSKRQGTEVAAIVHAGRRIVDEGGHMPPIEYMCQTHDIEPSELTAWFGPSSRAASYKFPVIEAEQQASRRWRDYLEYKNGYWHVDVHGRTVDDLLAFGVLPENMTINDKDTSAPGANYFSYRQYKNGQQSGFATNGFFFALRGDQAIPRAVTPDAVVAAPKAN